MILDLEQELDREILMETCLVFFSSFSGISTYLGDLDLYILIVLFTYIVREIDWAIVGSIDRSGVLSCSRLGDFESNWKFDRETVMETGLDWLVSSWFRHLGTLLFDRFIEQSGI